MHYVRGHPADYDAYWVPATGDESWSYKNLMHYFKKAESIQIDHLRTSEHHGTDGPLPVSRSVETPLGFAYLDALRQKGYTVVDDTSGAVFEGKADKHGVGADTEFHGFRVQQNSVDDQKRKAIQLSRSLSSAGHE